MKRVLERRKVERIMKNDTGKTVRSLLIAGVVVMAVSIMWPLLAEKYGTSKQTASNALQSETSLSETEMEAEMTAEKTAKETEKPRRMFEPVFRIEHDENGNANSHSAGGGGGSTGSFVNGASGTSSGSYSSSGYSS